MNVPVNSRSIDVPAELQCSFDKQRAAYLAAPEPSYDQRIADLKALARLLKDNKDELVAAINADYGNRSEFETLFAEYFVVLETIAHAGSLHCCSNRLPCGGLPSSACARDRLRESDLCVRGPGVVREFHRKTASAT